MCLRILVLLVLAMSAFSPLAATQADAKAPEKVTLPQDAEKISLAQLELELTPLRLAELENLATAWIALLEKKAALISVDEVQALTAEGEEKTKLVEGIAALNGEKTSLIDRVNVVLAAWKDKGGDPTEHQTYVGLVSGITIDPTDTSALLIHAKTWITSEQGGIRWGLNILFALLTLFVFKILSKLGGHTVDRGLTRAKKTPELLRGFLVNTVRKVTMFVGFVLALSFLEVDIGPFLAAMGAAGFIIGFALQGTLSNFASGVMILLYQPFDLGDVVTVAGVTGSVESMTLVSTTVKTFDNQVLIVPNSKIWGEVITNITGSETRRVDLVFGIGYGDDIGKAEGVLNEILSKHELVLAEPEPLVNLSELADSSVNFNVRPWVKTSDYWTVFWDVTRQVKERFDAEGISIPFPQRDVHVHQVTA
jgi:small conductance mechanosensitive channel